MSRSIPKLFTLAALAACSLLNAQTAPVTVSPTQLTFNTQSGTASPQNLVVSSNGSGPANFTAAASSTGWLSVSPASGTSPQIITVTPSANSLSTGSYGGFVTITSGSQSVVVPVTFNVNTAGTSQLTTTPSTLTFNFSTSSNTPQTQSLNVTSTAGAVQFTATQFTNTGGGQWLSVSPTTGTTPAAITATVNPTGLSAGVYFGAIALNPPGSTGLIVPVQVNISAPAAVTVSPSQLTFGFQTGTASPAPQTLSVTSSGIGAVSFTATASATSCGGSWLVVSPQSSATPSSLSVQINTTGLQPGNCTGTINISAPGASNPTQSIPVTLLVSNTPLLLVPTSNLTFNYQLGTGLPTVQTLQVTSSSTPLAFTATAAPLNSGPNFLTINPSSGTSPQAVTLSLNPTVVASLAPNTYAETVTISSPTAGNPAQTFTVTLNVSNNPMLLSSQQSVNFNFQIGQSTPASQTIVLTSSGSPLNYSVKSSATNCTGFLTATPASGATSIQTGLPSQVVIGIVTSGITTPQTCTGSVTITPVGGTPLSIPVTLNASTTPLVTLSPAAINVVATPGTAAITQNISLTSTDFSTPLNFTATANTNPAGLTWLSVAPNTGTSPASLSIIINPANLAPGVYVGSINVTSTSTGVTAQTVPVTLTVAVGAATVSPATLSFIQPLGGPLPAAQTVTISGIPSGATAGAIATFFNGTNWLTTSTSGSTVTITPNGANLPQGTYSGVVTVFVPGSTNSPIYIPVTYTVGGASTFALTPGALSFTYQSGAAVPAPVSVQVAASNGAAVAFNAVATAPPGTAGGILFLSVNPASGTTPGNLTVTLNPTVIATLATGIYTNTVTLTSPSAPGVSQTFPVTLTVTAAGPPSVTGVISGATFQPGAIAPGELVSIFGTNIGPATPVNLTLTPSGAVSTNIGNVTVTVNGIPAPLTYVSANQINAVVPYEIAGTASATIVVTSKNTAAAPIVVNVNNTVPGIFTTTMTGSGQGAIVNQDGSLNSASNPAARGTYIAVYATGGGIINPSAVTGSVTQVTATLPKNGAPVTATIGGVAAQVQYDGPAPGIVAGVMQVNVLVPANAPTGVQTIVISAGGASSPATTTVAIR